jgi:transcriptional regulator with XRE-family HTH domain
MAEETLAKRFGRLVRRLRQEGGYSQEEFSFRVGLHQTYVSSVERGERNVTIQTADRIAKALGTTLADLFTELERGSDDSADWRPSRWLALLGYLRASANRECNQRVNGHEMLDHPGSVWSFPSWRSVYLVPALQPYLIEPIWEQFRALLPERETNHPLGCHRSRISDRTVFEKLVQVLVFGCAYERIADECCSATTLRRRRDEWIEAGVMATLRELALEAYDKLSSAYSFRRWPSIAASPRLLVAARRRAGTP